MTGNTDRLSGFRRITIKIGSSLLVDDDKSLRRSWLDGLAADIAGLRSRGSEVLVVSSGAIALGRAVMGLPKRALKLEESQAAAAVGQIALAHAWSGALASHDLVAGQILITLHDTETRRRYLNARATMATLLGLGAVPVINENDTVATHEIRYGDNDRLAARVSTMAGADLLILLSDVDGLYTAPPAGNPEARFIDRVEALTPEIEAMAGAAGSELSRGGMRTKIDAARIATRAGCAMVIASGKRDHPVAAIAAGERATWFDTHMPVANARKTWIAGYLEPDGRLHVDDGALRALESGKSLLAAGVARVEGDFERGDTVAIVDASGRERGRGLAAYGAGEAQAIAGRQSSQILETLGYAGRAAMIHRDDLVLTAGNPRGTEEAGENNDAHDA